MAAQSYSSIIEILRQFAEGNQRIKRFRSSFFEQLDGFTSESNSFPLIFATPNEVSFEENIDSYSFRVYALDLLSTDRSNEEAILNSTLFILRDLNNWLRLDQYNGLNILNTPTPQPVNNFGVDNTVGWYCDFEIEAEAFASDCSIPFESNFQLTGVTCDAQYIQRFLTCETLEECSTFLNLESRVDFLESLTGNSISLSNGLNTYTGGTATNPSINISAATLSTLVVTGNTSLQNFLANDANINGNVTIAGNVEVLGTATTLNTQTVQTLDNNILLNYSGTHLTAIGGGISILSGKTNGDASKLLIDANGNWTINSSFGINNLSPSALLHITNSDNSVLPFQTDLNTNGVKAILSPWYGVSNTYGALYIISSGATPTSNNYTLATDLSNLYINTVNGGGSMQFRAGGNSLMTLSSGALVMDTRIICAPSTINLPSLEIPTGVVPITPNNGAVWYDNGKFKFRESGSTITIPTNYSYVVAKELTQSSPLSGTTSNTLLRAVLIPANTITVGDIIRINSYAVRSTAAGSATQRYYFNTSPTLAGATLFGTQTAAVQGFAMNRVLVVRSATETHPTINATVSTSLGESQVTNNIGSPYNINWTQDIYIIQAFQNAAITDSTVSEYMYIQKL